MLKKPTQIPQTLIRVDFARFKTINPNCEEAFELLCYHLFCRKFNRSEGLLRFKNHAGLETMPLREGMEVIGWQAKFFENAINYTEFTNSIEKAKTKYPDLSKIILYTNIEPGEERPKSKTKKKATKRRTARKIFTDKLKELGIIAEWVIPSIFEILLNSPKNLDLAQYYFDTGDTLGFLTNSLNPKLNTFLESKEFLLLPLLKDSGRTSVANICDSVWNSPEQNHLIVGHPGSGKSYLMYYLFRHFAGLNLSSDTERVNFLAQQKAIPVLINLKDSFDQTLEELLRNRLRDYDVAKKNFIYIFDGLDELTQDKADTVLSYILKLLEQDTTLKLIISCRSGNINRIRAKDYIKDITEYVIADLSIDHITHFFEAKANAAKQGFLTALCTSNPVLLSETKDILLIALLWETIEQLGPKSAITDLIEEKIKLLLNSRTHKKNIDILNLLDIKSEAILELNQEISFQFQEKFQYRFSKKEIQEIILNKFPRMDYKSANEILDYLSHLFFDHTPSTDGTQGGDFGHIYQHRRYQEFFFTQRLKKEFENDPLVLRSLNVLSNKDYFEGFFLPYLRKEYEHRENLLGILDINLIDVYLGNYSGFGVDQAYYVNSANFIPALANQNPYRIEEFLDSESFRLKNVIYININEVSAAFAKWQEDKKDYHTNDYLTSIWSGGLSSLLDNAVVFFEADNKEAAEKLLQNFHDIHEIFCKNKFSKWKNKSSEVENPFWKSFESYIFLLSHHKHQSFAKILTNTIRKGYSKTGDETAKLPGSETAKHKMLRCFFSILLKSRSLEIIEILSKLDDYEFHLFLDTVSNLDFIPLFIEDKNLQKEIKQRLKKSRVSKETYNVAFFKKFLQLSFNKSEKKILDELRESCLKTHLNSWIYSGIPKKYAIVSYALVINRFEDINADSHFHYYNETQLYCALFADLVEILQGTKSVKQTLRRFIQYDDQHYEKFQGSHLKNEISSIWAHIVATCADGKDAAFPLLRKLLFDKQGQFAPFIFYDVFKRVNSDLFNLVVNESDISALETIPTKVEYQEKVDQFFSLSLYYSKLNEQKSRAFFIAALKDSIVRHGWRKDPLVSGFLVNSLKIMWEHNWGSTDDLVRWTKEVFELAIRVTEITDGKGTWRGPLNVMEAVAPYNLEVAEELKTLLLEHSSLDVRNMAIGTILRTKVSMGEPVKALETEMKELSRDYDFQGKVRSEYYEEQISIYLSIAESELYPDADRLHSFDKMYNLMNEMKEKCHYYLTRDDLKIRNRYLVMCRKYNSSENVEEKNDETIVEKTVPASQENLRQQIVKANTKAKLEILYKKIKNYENGIVISEKATWQSLLDRTYKYFGNVQPFIRMLNDSHFPSSDWWDRNSKYYHIGLALALSDIRTRPEAQAHIARSTGHGGYYNMIKVYEFMGDKETCRKIFLRFIQMCHFLCR